MNCKNIPVSNYGRKRKLFERYVDDIICTVKDDPNKLLHEVNDLHLTFTLEILIDKRELAFLDMAVHVNEQRICKWYQKPADTGAILDFRSCARFHYKKNTIEGTIHGLVRCTNNGKIFKHDQSN